MGQSGRLWAVGQRCCGAALGGLCRGAAAFLGLPGFPRAHSLLLGALVGLGPLLRGRGDPHSVLASPHNRLEARLTSSAAAWTWLLIGSLLVASHPWLRPPWGRALRAAARMGVALALSRAGHALGHALEAATGSCRRITELGTLLLPLDEPAACRGAGHTWEGFGPAPQAFALVHCGLGLAEEAAALGRRLYGGGRGKMAAGGSKMAAGYGVSEGSKMAAGYEAFEGSKMAAGPEMAAGYGMVEGSKMAARSKMAAGYGMMEGSKMAAGYDAMEGPKMAAGYRVPYGPKMAAGSGWAEPPHANYPWAGPPGWEGRGGGHAPSWGRRGHFEGSGYGGGRHFESAGGHFEGGHFERGGVHFEGRHFEGGHLEGGHFERPAGHFEGRHFDGRHFEGVRFERGGGHFEGGHFEGGHFERGGVHFGGGHFEGGHFEGGSHFEPTPYTTRHFHRPGRHLAGRHLSPDHALREADPALRSPEGAPPVALSILYLLALALLVTWHLLLVVTLTYRNTPARNAAGAALGWAAWAVTYRGWYRWAWSPGPPGWG